MIVCQQCGNHMNQLADSCHQCNYQVEKIDGFMSFAPDSLKQSYNEYYGYIEGDEYCL